MMTTEERLERLEKEVAALKTAGAQPAGAAINQVRATEFVLEDEKGTRYALLGVDKNEPGLWLRDERGNPIWSAP